MYKAILLMLLAVVSSSAMAEWVEVDGTSNLEIGTSVYVDPTFHKSGNKVTLLELINFTTAQDLADKKYLSIKTHTQGEF